VRNTVFGDEGQAEAPVSYCSTAGGAGLFLQVRKVNEEILGRAIRTGTRRDVRIHAYNKALNFRLVLRHFSGWLFGRFDFDFTCPRGSRLLPLSSRPFLVQKVLARTGAALRAQAYNQALNLRFVPRQALFARGIDRNDFHIEFSRIRLTAF
jgi:hypothetical protein